MCFLTRGMTNEETIVFEERRGRRWNGLGRTIGRDCVITDRRIEDIEEACDNLLPLKKKSERKVEDYFFENDVTKG